MSDTSYYQRWRDEYPDKFLPENKVFSHIHRGDRIFIATACGEPQYLVQALIKYVETNPKGFFDTEIFHVWTLGVAPYTDEKFKRNFRLNSFFIGNNTRDPVNRGLADYSPLFFAQIPELFHRRVVPVDIALVQTSPPDHNGYMSLGVSVDITKAAVENASLVIVQTNPLMPRVHGDTFIHLKDVDCIMDHEEPLLKYEDNPSDEIAQRIGRYVSRIVEDGDTIQVGYGSIPNAILLNLENKSHLGVHTELLSHGVVELMKKGIVDNTKKTLDRGKTIATFCMGTRETYDYIHDNPAVEFRQVDYTNNPLVIAQNKNMTAINSALQIDLTGQATAESIGKSFYSGIGGQADFMRGAVLSPGGKTILTIQSTAENDTISRIVPFIPKGAGVTLTRGDIKYVVTEYGIAYLHGKNIRERAMELISIAHPRFRSWLIEEAKKHNLIYQDQAFIPGKKGEYPEELETYKTTRSKMEILLRPVKISDEPLLKELFYDLSDNSMYKRFVSLRTDMPHERLQEFAVIDYTKEMVILAVKESLGRQEILGLGQYSIFEQSLRAEVALVVKDEYQDRGIGTELLSYLTFLAKRQGLLGFTAEVLRQNTSMLHLFEKMGFEIHRESESDMLVLDMTFKEQ